MLYRLIRPQLSPSTRAKVQVWQALDVFTCSVGRSKCLLGRSNCLHACFRVALAAGCKLTTRRDSSVHLCLLKCAHLKHGCCAVLHACRCAPPLPRQWLSCHAAWVQTGCLQSLAAPARGHTTTIRHSRRCWRMWPRCASSQLLDTVCEAWHRAGRCSLQWLNCCSTGGGARTVSTQWWWRGGGSFMCTSISSRFF